MPLFKSQGKPKKPITYFMKDIEKNIIPALNRSLELNINNYPRYTYTTYAEYLDEINRFAITFYSNHVEIESGELFISISYKGSRDDAGVVNPKDVDSVLAIVKEAASEIGFKTKSEIEAEKQAKEQKRIDDEKRKQEERERIKQKRREEQEKETNAKQKQEPEQTEQEPDTYDTDKTSFMNETRKMFEYMSNLPEGSKIEFDWITMPNEGHEVVHILLHATHVAGNNFYVETQHINPKTETILNSADTITIINKVSDALKFIPSVEMKNEKGKTINMPDSLDDTETDFSVNI